MFWVFLYTRFLLQQEPLLLSSDSAVLPTPLTPIHSIKCNTFLWTMRAMCEMSDMELSFQAKCFIPAWIIVKGPPPPSTLTAWSWSIFPSHDTTKSNFLTVVFVFASRLLLCNAVATETPRGMPAGFFLWCSCHGAMTHFCETKKKKKKIGCIIKVLYWSDTIWLQQFSRDEASKKQKAHTTEVEALLMFVVVAVVWDSVQYVLLEVESQQIDTSGGKIAI